MILVNYYVEINIMIYYDVMICDLIMYDEMDHDIDMLIVIWYIVCYVKYDDNYICNLLIELFYFWCFVIHELCEMVMIHYIYLCVIMGNLLLIIKLMCFYYNVELWWNWYIYFRIDLDLLCFEYDFISIMMIWFCLLQYIMMMKSCYWNDVCDCECWFCMILYIVRIIWCVNECILNFILIVIWIDMIVMIDDINWWMIFLWLIVY